jgi:hypothetical protein
MLQSPPVSRQVGDRGRCVFELVRHPLEAAASGRKLKLKFINISTPELLDNAFAEAREEGAIIKTSMWRKWPGKQAPVVEYIVQSIDGAFEEDEDADYSARTTWGVFDIFRADNVRCCRQS